MGHGGGEGGASRAQAALGSAFRLSDEKRPQGEHKKKTGIVTATRRSSIDSLAP